MSNFNKVLLLAFSTITLGLQAQVAYLEKLGDIVESSSYVTIEQNGKFSYSSGQSIFSSSDEGLTWRETSTPLDFTSGHTRYSGLKNGNYILITGRKMHYRSNGQWNLLLIEGDSIFDSRPTVIDDRVILFKDNIMHVYDDNAGEVNLSHELDPYCCYWVEVFQNHFIVRGENYERQIWTKDLQYLNTVYYSEPLFVTKEGIIIKKITTSQQAGKYGNTLEISMDNGQSFTLFHQSDDEEFRFVGEIDGRLYFRGYLTQHQAWSAGHYRARLGYFDLQTGNITEVSDGNKLPVIVNDTLYHRIGSTYFKYPEGDLNNRIKLSSLTMAARPIKKIRRASDGTMYALTNAFLYKSYDRGKTWDNLLDFHWVVDIDLDEDDNLYCTSEGAILKSSNEGVDFAELPKQYSGGPIEGPNEIISLGSNRLIVKGTGDYVPETTPVGCIDCYNSYPHIIFISDNDGNNWEPKFVLESDFPTITAEDNYGYPSNQVIKSSYFVKTSEDIVFTGREYHFFSSVYNYGGTIMNRSDFSVRTTKQASDKSNDIRYGLTIDGDLIKNNKGQVYASRDFGEAYSELGHTSIGDVFPGAAEESIYVISDSDLSEGFITYQANYGTSFAELYFKIKNTDEVIPNSFDKVYTDGKSDFLFSGSNTYEIVEIDPNSTEETTLSEQDPQISIYPNPVSEILNVNIQQSQSPFTKVEIYDAKARLMSTSQSVQPQFNVSLENYASGLYVIRIINDNVIYNQKIFKL